MRNYFPMQGKDFTYCNFITAPNFLYSLKMKKGDNVMKIAIALEENSYSSSADRRLGRAAYFILINPETNDYEIIENEAKDEATGAGLKAVRTLVNLGVNEIIAGEIGPKAAVLINEFEIPVYKMGEFAKVSEILKNYKENKLEKYDLSPKPQGLRMA